MPEKVVIVALNIERNDKLYEAYEGLPAQEKINLLCAQIEKICQSLQKSNPDAQWIIAWREYGIFEPNSKFLSPETEKFLKTQIVTLTKRYPNLSVISGTIATKTPIKLSTEAKETILNEYGSSSHVQMLEEGKDPHNPTKQRRSDELQVTTHLKKINDTPLNTQVELVTNTAYLFQGESLKSHGKIAPYYETKEEKELDNAIYSPGKIESQIPRFKVGKKFVIGVEICREHDFQVLRHFPGPTPLIHFVISDGVNLNLANIEGAYVVQIDSKVKPCLIHNNNKLYSNYDVCLMQLNALDKNAVLSGPTMPFIPFEKVILNMFDKILKQFTDKKDPKYITLATMRGEFVESAKSIDNMSMYNCLETNIQKYGAVLQKIDGTKALSGFAEFFFYRPLPKPQTHLFLAELKALLMAEQKKGYVKKDFLSGGPVVATAKPPLNPHPSG